MATRNRRTEWRLEKGTWTRSLGDRGTRIRLFQKRSNGPFYRSVWLPGRGEDRKCIGTTDRREAERIGRQLLATLLVEEPDARQVAGPVGLQYLLERYCAECVDFLDNAPHTKQEAKIRTEILVGHFGATRDVRTLTDADVHSYTQRRLKGGIIRPNGKVTKPVRARSPQADLKLLSAALKWAMTIRVGTGRLLTFNPLHGVRIISERNPKRPVSTWERFQKTREAMRALAEQASTADERMTWVRIELLVVLLEATGRRIGSIRQLRWEDLDLQRGEIHWRAEADKKGKEWFTPVGESLMGELKAFRRTLGALSGWIFPAPDDPTQPIDIDTLKVLMLKAEQEAKLPKLDGGLFHPFRRKWATERKHLPLKDVAEAGGWKSPQVILTSYQHADRDTMLAVMNEPTKLTERAVAGRR